MSNNTLQLDKWIIDLSSGEVREQYGDNWRFLEERLEPVGIKLLLVLSAANGAVVTKQMLLDEVWTDTVVSEEALSRAISRIRKLLNDNPRQPTIIETLPKRGYRLIASPCTLLSNGSTKDPTEASSEQTVVDSKASVNPLSQPYTHYVALAIVTLTLVIIGFTWWPKEPETTRQTDRSLELIAQADVYYHKQTRSDNAMAIELYQRASSFTENLSDAYSGLANATVQRVIRSTNDENVDWQQSSLSYALEQELVTTQSALSQLEHALTLTEKAVKIAPDSDRAYKARGFVLSALQKMDAAVASYQHALSINPDAWDVLINLGDIEEISGDLYSAIEYYSRAYLIISNTELVNPIISPTWRAELGAMIGEKQLSVIDYAAAETWFRRVLTFAPFNKRATLGLVKVLNDTGRADSAAIVCEEFAHQVGEPAC